MADDIRWRTFIWKIQALGYRYAAINNVAVTASTALLDRWCAWCMEKWI
jgi:hypothetical protein